MAEPNNKMPPSDEQVRGPTPGGESAGPSAWSPGTSAVFTELLRVLPQLLWFLLTVILLVVFYQQILIVASALRYRLQSGGQVKIASLELEAIKTKGTTLVVPAQVRVVKADPNFNEKREEYYNQRRNIMLVHQLARSTTPGQEYDVILYLSPHVSPNREGTLKSVKRVEYYFGGMFGDNVFVSEDRGRAFQVVVSAYGPMLCIARVTFSDASPKNPVLGTDYEIFHRYVDFEMGTYAPEQESTK